MNRYRDQAAAALSAVEVRPPGAFLWFGTRVAAPRGDLVDGIGQQLYAGFYDTGAPQPRGGGLVTPGDDGSEFLRALSHANCGRGSWQAGWQVAAVDGDTIAVVRPDGLRVLAPAEDCRGEGAHADVRVAKELVGLTPGFYIALGDAGRPGASALRLCWSIAATGAVAFVARVTYALNRADLPFRLELLDNPARYGRRSTAVLLLARTDFAAAVTLLRPLLLALGPHLADGVPAFTKPLARGLAVAEEPESGSGFGEHRCGLLAEAIVAAGERRLRTTEERLAIAHEVFGVAGISLDAPYLQPGSDDAYELA